MANLQQIMDAIQSMDTRLTGSINDVKQQNKTLISEFNKINIKINVLSEKQTKISQELTNVNMQVELLKQHRLSSEIIVTGLPDKLLQKEMLIPTINKVLNVIDGKELNYWDYRSIFLLKKKSNTSGFTPICIQLCSSAHKNLLIKNQKKNGPILLQQIDSTVPATDTRVIVIKDRVTPYNSQLLKETYAFKEKYNYKYAWFKDSVLLRKTESSKILHILSKRDLEKLTEEESLNSLSTPSCSS